jgi:hypothetical protein
MSLCIVAESGLCSTCSTLGRKQNNEPNRVLELKDLCKTCVRKLPSGKWQVGSYVGVVKEPRKYYAEEET